MATTTQAQLIIDVYPSRDNPTSQALWIFSGSSTANRTSTIRSSQNFHERDSWTFRENDEFYTANKPTNQLVSLSSLFSRANNPKDIDSVNRRLSISHGFGPLSTNSILFPDNATNAPTITIGGTDKNISWIFMNDADNYDEIGIRGTPPNNLVYSSNAASSWAGAGHFEQTHRRLRSRDTTNRISKHGAQSLFCGEFP